MGKKPYLELYINDFRADTLGLSSTSTGIWIRALCDMAWQGDYKLTGTLTEICRICGCTPGEWDDFVIAVKRRNIAPVTETAEIITVISRRRLKEHKEREAARLRKQKERKSRPCPKKVTTPLSSSSSYSSSKTGEGQDAPTPALRSFIDHWVQVIGPLILDPQTSIDLGDLYRDFSRELPPGAKPAVDILCAEIDELAKRPPKNRNVKYFAGMIWGKLNE